MTGLPVSSGSWLSLFVGRRYDESLFNSLAKRILREATVFCLLASSAK